MKNAHKYFDGIPQWIWDLTPEERNEIIAEEKAKMVAYKPANDSSKNNK